MRTQRYHHPLSLLLIDLDKFKEINERYGHQVGDEVLREVGFRVLQKECRTTDIVAQYGVDEFALILPETGREAAGMLAQRLARVVRERVFSSQQVKLTLSLGIASHPEDGTTAAQLEESAGWALSQAKQAGGDAFRSAEGKGGEAHG